MRGFIVAMMLVLTGCVVADASLSSVKDVSPNLETTMALKPNQCLPTDSLAPLLEKQYNEKLISSGTFDSTRGPLVMMLFISASGSWTLVSAGRSGIACALIWGENYTVNKPKKRGKSI